jgi:hypothetical protein
MMVQRGELSEGWGLRDGRGKLELEILNRLEQGGHVDFVRFHGRDYPAQSGAQRAGYQAIG